MTSTIPRLTTRSIRTAEHIRDRKPFTTSGALKGLPATHLGAWDSGQLSGLDLAWFRHDLPMIDYVVWSYSTPIAWHMTEQAGEPWHRVGQSFSATTGKHQGNLYLIPHIDHAVTLAVLPSYRHGEPGSNKWRVECYTCDKVVSHHVYKKDASQAAHTHRITGRYGYRP